VCERLWVSAPSTIIDLVHLHLDEWTSGGHGLLGALPRSMKSRRKIPDRRRATQPKVVRPNGRQPEKESARRRSRSLHLASDVADDADRNSKPGGSCGGRRPRAAPFASTQQCGRPRSRCSYSSNSAASGRSNRCAKTAPLPRSRSHTLRSWSSS
jgi:hypothetical protein